MPKRSLEMRNTNHRTAGDNIGTWNQKRSNLQAEASTNKHKQAKRKYGCTSKKSSRNEHQEGGGCVKSLYLHMLQLRLVCAPAARVCPGFLSLGLRSLGFGRKLKFRIYALTTRTSHARFFLRSRLRLLLRSKDSVAGHWRGWAIHRKHHALGHGGASQRCSTSKRRKRSRHAPQQRFWSLRAAWGLRLPDTRKPRSPKMPGALLSNCKHTPH